MVNRETDPADEREPWLDAAQARQDELDADVALAKYSAAYGFTCFQSEEISGEQYAYYYSMPLEYAQTRAANHRYEMEKKLRAGEPTLLRRFGRFLLRKS